MNRILFALALVALTSATAHAADRKLTEDQKTAITASAIMFTYTQVCGHIRPELTKAITPVLWDAKKPPPTT
jgi:hypothetical protein